MTIMGCYHDLKARVTKLELVLPAVEKSLLAEASHLRFIYSPGAEWHASLPSDENHFMKRDLPRFLHNLYDDCRGPPRLFLLDKYGPLNPFNKSSSFKAFMLFFLKRSDSYID
jgi:hypothetical protein